ncbi:hypothetical protein Ahy_B05g078294 [Arachis hypogaea]|uniref:SWIM-type domain-containing protein n=1 Tax=Arachis hypogaea TaxID=3818 RepID=A0A444Z6S4_ARAHY|nr:hypothetical protein Ahy_B05g078294 [Arachis hypogaea]
MDDSTSDCQLNQGEVDYEFESNEVPEVSCCRSGPLSLVDDQFVPKVGMTFTTLEDAKKFYKNYAKAASFSTRVRSTNKKGNEIKNQLITCSREGKWKSKISPTEKTNPTVGLNCPTRIYIHTLKDVGAWIISKVVLNHSHPCCPSKAKMLKQHRELSMSIRRTIENNEEAGIRPSKTYQSFVAAAGGHRELNFIEKNVRNYINREVRNVSEQEDAKEFRKYLLRMKEKNQNFFFELELKEDQSIKLAFWADARSRAAFEYFGDVISFDTTYNTNREQAERESDAADFHTVIPCATKSSIEAQFQDVYTHQKFREVQAQFRGKANCITRLTNSALGYSVYEVGEQVSSSIFNKFVVTYDSVAAEVKCQCLLFESRGILCRHALSVLSFEQVSQVSPRYILERWSKKVKRRHTHIKSSHDEPLLELRSKRFDKLFFRSQNICKFASESEELTVILHRAYDNVMDEMESLKAKRKGTSSLSHEDANLESVNELQSPPRIRTRGRPKNRLSSKLDKQIANATKKKKTKGLSEINLFDAASVVHSNSSQYQGHRKRFIPCLLARDVKRTITTNDVNGKQVQEGFGVSGIFALCSSCVDAPFCVVVSSWLESVKPRLNDGIGSVLGTYDAIRAIIISAAASSGAGLLRDHMELGEVWVCFLQVVGGSGVLHGT